MVIKTARFQPQRSIGANRLKMRESRFFQKFFAGLPIDSQRWDNPAQSAEFSYSFVL
ncbi:MAG: hypothetical protein ACREQV_13505 [Candidatus Binatia bacterium]